MDKFLRETHNHSLSINKMYIYSHSQDSAILWNTFSQSLDATPLSIGLWQLSGEIFCVTKSLNSSLEQQLSKRFPVLTNITHFQQSKKWFDKPTPKLYNDPAWAGRLDQMTFSAPFRPQPFCDSVTQSQ